MPGQCNGKARVKACPVFRRARAGGSLPAQLTGASGRPAVGPVAPGSSIRSPKGLGRATDSGLATSDRAAGLWTRGQSQTDVPRQPQFTVGAAV